MPWGAVQPAPLLQHQLQLMQHLKVMLHVDVRAASGGARIMQSVRLELTDAPPPGMGLFTVNTPLALKLIECDPRLAVARGLESIDIAASRIAAARKKSDGAARSQCKPIKRSRRSAFEAPATR